MNAVLASKKFLKGGLMHQQHTTDVDEEVDDLDSGEFWNPDDDINSNGH